MPITKIQPLHPPLVAPQGATAAGVTVDGQQLYTEERPRSKNQPLYEKGPDGKAILDEQGNPIRIWKKNPLTGEPLLPMNEVVPWTEKMLYYLESQGNGNVVRVKYCPPTEADLLAAERRQKVEKAHTDIAEAFVDLGMDPAEVLSELKNLAIQRGQEALSAADVSEKTDEELHDIVREEVDAEEVAAPAPAVVYPLLRPGGMYEFSDGSKRRLKKVEALKLQRALTKTEEAEEAARAEAKANAEATPDF